MQRLKLYSREHSTLFWAATTDRITKFLSVNEPLHAISLYPEDDAHVLVQTFSVAQLQ
jgi:hypothetical protein